MAGISGSELAAIHKQIHAFPDTHRQLESSLNLEVGLNNRHRSRVTGFLRMSNMSGNIQKLESEIEQLEKAIKQQQEKNRKMQIWQQSQVGRQLNNSNADMIKAQLESLKYQIDQLGEITGVKLVETKTEVLERGKTSCRKRLQTEGYCGQVDFQLDMEIEESMKPDTTMEAKIVQLAIAASENITEDLESTLESLALEKNAHGFMRLLQPYNQWLSARDKTFKHFTAKYLKIAKKESTEDLSLNHTSKNVSFTITWTFNVTDTLDVVPDLQLNIQAPKKVSSNKVLETAPDMFQLMLKELGVETAIHSLIKLLLET